jgi:hypothetical protein
MGVVWRAHDRLLHRQVAVKEIRFPSGAGEVQTEKAAARVMREARAAASLNHPNAVAVFDVMQEQGRAFIVMELIDAPTLDDVVSEQPLTPQRAAEIGLDVIAVLKTAHALGLVHRDVKPANVMIQRDAHVKLADFGIVSVKGDPKLTATGAIMGSPRYMAPEQARDEDATPATDIWALGATLFFCVEGKSPFDRGQPIPTLTAVLSEEPSYSEASGELRPAIAACLQKDPVQRPSLEELADMLSEVARGATAPTPTPAAEPTLPVTAPGTTAKETVPRTRTSVQAEPVSAGGRSVPSRERGKRGLAWVAGTLAAIALVGAAVFFFTRETENAPERNNAGEQVEQKSTATIPEGWTRYTDSATGYEIAYPEDWEPLTGRGTGQSVDFEDPETGAYMRVDWTDTPGDSAVGAWEAAEPDLEARLPDYERITIEPTTFQSYDEAALWEYTWGGEQALHAINLGFVTGEYGFALNYQAPEADWDALQETFETFKDTFRAP